jgi:hypothetical protein
MPSHFGKGANLKKIIFATIQATHLGILLRNTSCRYAILDEKPVSDFVNRQKFLNWKPNHIYLYNCKLANLKSNEQFATGNPLHSIRDFVTDTNTILHRVKLKGGCI